MAENSYNHVQSNEKESTQQQQQQQQQQQPSSSDNADASRPLSAARGAAGAQTDRDDRLKQVRERQNEERMRKLNEIKQQALQAQRIREQKEEERRRRIEDMRTREQERRAQVEERKRQIEDVERDRREYIIRKNQEREARLESKRRSERCSSVFAFGSSTPRMLEPADTGGSSFWTSRRATSTTNVMFAASAAPFSRRSSERELDTSGKKRATSAGGLDREQECRMSTSMYAVLNWQTPAAAGRPEHVEDNEATPPSATLYTNRVARRRTDLMPTIPSPRDTPLLKSSSSRAPGRAYSMSRLDQLAQPRSSARTLKSEQRAAGPAPLRPQPPALSLSRSMTHLPRGRNQHHLTTPGSMLTVQAPRMNKTERMRRQRLLETSGNRSGEATPSRPGSAMSGVSVSSGVVMRRPASSTARRPRPASIAGTGLTADHTKRNSTSNGDVNTDSSKPPAAPRTPKPKVDRNTAMSKSAIALKSTGRKNTPIQSPTRETAPPPITHTPKRKNSATAPPLANGDDKPQPAVEEVTPPPPPSAQKEPEVNEREVAAAAAGTGNGGGGEGGGRGEQEEEMSVSMMVKARITNEDEMTASMIAKTRITTEEEAKAAIAERRRLAREEAERQAELERQRAEEEARLQAERERAEEEEQRRLEEETLRLAQEQREAEERRLREAIEDAQRREAEERERRAEEERQRAEKEAAERRAREEAERARIEKAVQREREEKEREERRKRVEAIMKRTRGRGQAGEGSGEGGQQQFDNSGALQLEQAVPLNGSNAVHILEQQLTANANPASVDVLDSLNSNKSEAATQLTTV